MKTTAPRAKRRLPRKGLMSEWDRMSRLLRLVGMTGFIENVRPVSLLLISSPGTGKTELIERFRPNRNLSYFSDLTWMGLMQTLRNARTERITHLVFTEFQKLFQRRMSVANTCLGAMVQAMEEGVYRVRVGGDDVDLEGVRVGIIGAITHGTLKRKRSYLEDNGFLSRAFVMPWKPPDNEVAAIMGRINRNDTSDIEPIDLWRWQALADGPIPIKLSTTVGDVIQRYVARRFPRGAVLRIFMRFRALAQAAALDRWDGKTRPPHVTLEDWTYIETFDDYWQRLLPIEE